MLLPFIRKFDFTLFESLLLAFYWWPVADLTSDCDKKNLSGDHPLEDSPWAGLLKGGPMN